MTSLFFLSTMPPLWSLVVALAAAAALVPRGAFAQTSTATCMSSYGWMNNSLGQDPCVVASYLLNVCGADEIPPLPAGYIYEAPTTATQNSCVCNTVTYSMISACADCQNGSYLSWSSWSSSCSQMSIRQYPMDIPSGTKVPNWAYLNVTGSGFDPSAAQITGDLRNLPQPIMHPSLTSSSTSSSATATGLSTTSAPSSTSTDVGTIAGGIVGGIAGAAAIVGLATWYFIRRHRSSTTPSAAFSDIGGGPGHTQSFYSTNTTTLPMAQQSRLYDPSDPTTFPDRPHSFAGPVASSSNVDLNPSMPSHVFSQQSRSGQYTGVPEV
ncbi:hypothetical protein BD769DRAFT_1771858 [Suillus cothurnatus]|nr:hypothetical protein BD769DRAFT_1771858 [Suillus cothurnatus]